MVNKFNVFSAVVLTVVSLAGAAAAQDVDPPSEGAPESLRADVEVDPLAYAFRGYSLHVGLGAGRFRADLGAFAADLPKFFHGNEGFAVAFNGFGAKLDVFLQDDWRGLFAGVEAAVVDGNVLSPDSQLERQRRAQFGVRAGFRIPVTHGFYVTPWIGLGYVVGAGDRVIGNERFEESPLVIFPTVHLGYRLR